MRVKTRKGAPTPDDLDELIAQGLEGAGVLPRAPARDRGVRARVHAPRRAAADGDAVRLAVPHLARPAASSRATSCRVEATATRRNILLLRTGEKKRGVVGLFQPGLPGEVARACRCASWASTSSGAASYLVSLYCSAAVLTDDALGVLENVEVGKYHEYK